MFSAHLHGTPLGTVRLWSSASGLRRLDFVAGMDVPCPGEALATEDPPDHVAHTLEELREYFAGSRRAFDIPLDLDRVTPFQSAVYERLLQIPYGEVVSYGTVAADLADAQATARAVGQAVGANPVPILVPCHRVVGSDHRLVGYGGGIDRKVALLRIEGLHVDGASATSRVHPEILRLPL